MFLGLPPIHLLHARLPAADEAQLLVILARIGDGGCLLNRDRRRRDTVVVLHQWPKMRAIWRFGEVNGSYFKEEVRKKRGATGGRRGAYVIKATRAESWGKFGNGR